MPFLDVKIYESRLDPTTEAALIDRLTQAVVDVFGETIRDKTWVALTGIPASRWGVAGKPGTTPESPA